MSADLKVQANCRGHIGLLKPSNDGLPFTYPACRRVHCELVIDQVTPFIAIIQPPFIQ